LQQKKLRIKKPQAAPKISFLNKQLSMSIKSIKKNFKHDVLQSLTLLCMLQRKMKNALSQFCVTQAQKVQQIMRESFGEAERCGAQERGAESTAKP
jgi:hypothetical protein